MVDSVSVTRLVSTSEIADDDLGKHFKPNF